MKRLLRVLCWCLNPDEESLSPQKDEEKPGPNNQPSEDNTYATSVKNQGMRSAEQRKMAASLPEIRFIDGDGKRLSVEYVEVSPTFGMNKCSFSLDNRSTLNEKDAKEKHRRKRRKRRRKDKKDKTAKRRDDTRKI